MFKYICIYANRRANNKGFSLIELSLVIIVVSLIIMGIIGGKSLIDNVKMNALINDINTIVIAYDNYKNDTKSSKINDSFILLSTLIEKGYLDRKNNFISESDSDPGMQFYPSKVSPYGFVFAALAEPDENGTVMQIIIASIQSGALNGAMTEEFCNKFSKKISMAKFGSYSFETLYQAMYGDKFLFGIQFFN